MSPETTHRPAQRVAALRARGRGRVFALGLLLAGAVFAAPSCAFALDPSLDVSQYAHTAWKISEGFSKGVINSIAQTPDGYLWLGTEFGLLRFDGVRTVPWTPPAGDQLPSNTISRLLVTRFRVAASNNSGVWNEAGTSFTFSIAPAYYQTAWFRLTCVAAFLALLWALYQRRLRQAVQRVQHRMEGRLIERERIARELHDTLLQSVQGLILKFDAVAKQIPCDEPARLAMEEALDRADEVMGEGRERVRNLRSGASALSDLPAAFQRVADETASGREATFKTIVEGSVRELNPMVLEESYSIGREALINALAHSGGLHVEVEIMYDPRQFRLRVRDDGRGVDPTILEKGGRPGHWGMQGMRERAQGIGAQLGLWSRPGSGTEVELLVPAATAYRSGRAPAKVSWLSRVSGNGR